MQILRIMESKTNGCDINELYSSIFDLKITVVITLKNQMPHKYTFCILKVYTNSTLKPSGLFGVYFLYTLNKIKLKTCFGDLYFLYK